MAIVTCFCITLLIGLTSGTVRTLRMQVLALLFGGTAVIVAGPLGGASVTVPNMFLVFFWTRALNETRRSQRPLLVSKPTFALGAAVLCGSVLAVVAPRLMQDRIMVLAPFRDVGAGDIAQLVPLRPVMGNLTQTVYAVANVLTFASARVLMRRPQMRQVFADAVVTLALLNAGAAALNILEFYSGMPSLLDTVRTAYATLHHNWGGGILPRIQGTFPEASAFAGVTMGLFGFTFQLWLDNVNPRRTGIAAGFSLVFLLLSTSGTAYAGLMLYLVILAAGLFKRAASARATPRLAWVLVVVALVVSAAQVLLLFDAPVIERVGVFFQDTLFNKLESESGKERTSWNAAAWNSFLESYGLGLGFGSVRSSSFLVTLVASSGVIGTASYVAFLQLALRARDVGSPDPRSREVVLRTAARHMAATIIISGCLSGLAFDLGPGFYMCAALASLSVNLNPVVHQPLAPEIDSRGDSRLSARFPSRMPGSST